MFKSKNTSDKNKNGSGDMANDIVTEIRNWYSDRYETVLVQRNILFLLMVACCLGILIAVLVVGQIATSKTVYPFVIEVEDKTGITNVVNPLARQDLTSDEALSSYFLMKYIRYREAYDPMLVEEGKTFVRLLSKSEIYYDYVRNLVSDKGLIATYGDVNSLLLKVRSTQYLTRGKIAQIRFALTETQGAKRVFNKIATIEYEYSQMELNFDDRMINPLGFRVIGYRVDDDNV